MTEVFSYGFCEKFFFKTADIFLLDIIAVPILTKSSNKVFTKYDLFDKKFLKGTLGVEMPRLWCEDFQMVLILSSKFKIVTTNHSA